MRCKWRAAVTDLARTGIASTGAEAHVARCGGCAEWLASQRALQRALKEFALGKSEFAPGAGVERAVLAAFGEKRRRVRVQRLNAIAAGLVALALLGVGGFLRGKAVRRPEAKPAIHMAATESAPTKKAEADVVAAAAPRKHKAGPVKRVQAQPATDAPPNPFIAIPYTLPLAAGERAWVVRMKLPVEALLSTGVPLAADGLDPGPVEADVVVGEDGRARAIRVVSAAMVVGR